MANLQQAIRVLSARGGIGNPRLEISDTISKRGAHRKMEALDGKCKCGEKWKNRKNNDEHIQ